MFVTHSPSAVVVAIPLAQVPKILIPRHDVLLGKDQVVELSVVCLLDIGHSLSVRAHHNGYQKVHHDQSQQEGGHEEERPIILVHCSLVERPKHRQILGLHDRNEDCVEFFINTKFCFEPDRGVLGASERDEHDDGHQSEGEGVGDTVRHDNQEYSEFLDDLEVLEEAQPRDQCHPRIDGGISLQLEEIMPVEQLQSQSGYVHQVLEVPQVGHYSFFPRFALRSRN